MWNAAIDVTFALISIIAACFGIVGNIVICIVVTKEEQLRTRRNALHVSLAAYDLYACVVGFVRNLLFLSWFILPEKYETILKINCFMIQISGIAISGNVFTFAWIALSRKRDTLNPDHDTSWAYYIMAIVLTFVLSLVQVVKGLTANGQFTHILCLSQSPLQEEMTPNVFNSTLGSWNISGNISNNNRLGHTNVSFISMSNESYQNSSLLIEENLKHRQSPYVILILLIIAIIVTFITYTQIFLKLHQLRRKVSGFFATSRHSAVPIGRQIHAAASQLNTLDIFQVTFNKAQPKRDNSNDDICEISIRMDNERASNSASQDCDAIVPPSNPRNAVMLSVSQDKQILISNVIILAIFIAAYAPMGMMVFAILVFRVRVSPLVLKSAFLCIFANHVLNPYIYIWRCKHFKEGSIKLFTLRSRSSTMQAHIDQYAPSEENHI